MCLIIAFVAIVYAISAFIAGDILLGLSAVVIAVFFTGLLIKNIMDVKKMRNEKNNDKNKEES
jgi:membrane protein implicated in regulation of membrane protease activity